MGSFPDPSEGARGSWPTGQAILTVAVAPSSAHPRLVRVRVDDVAVGDLCFRTDVSRDRVIAALVHHAGAEVRRERELITPYDPALVEPRPRPNGRATYPATPATIGGSA